MEGLAAASSVVAVVSIALQLAESIHSLVQFCKTVENAPENISAVVDDLEVLAEVLDNSSQLNIQDRNINKVLRNCQTKVLHLRSILERRSSQLKASNRYKRKLAAVKFTLENKELDSIKSAIQDAKLTLSLAQGNSIQELILSNSSVQKQFFATLQSSSLYIQQQSTTVEIHSPNMQIQHQKKVENTSTSLVTEKNVLGQGVPQDSCQEVAPNSIRDTTWETNTTKESFKWLSQPMAGRVMGAKDRQYASITTPLLGFHTRSHRLRVATMKSSGFEETIKEETTYVGFPNTWLQMIGINRGIQLVARSTGYSIQPFRAVSPDSLIFEFCREGNLAGVRTLLKRREASPYDRDPLGWTPLSVAVKASQLEVAEFLLQEGADPHVRDWRHNHQPIEGVFDATGAEIEPKMALLRVLHKYRREDYDDEVLRVLLGRAFMSYRLHRDISLSMEERWDAVHKVLTMMMPNFPPESDDRIHILEAAITFYCLKEVLHKILNSIPGNIDRIASGSMLVHQAMLKRFLFRDPCSMRLLVQKTRNLHLCAKDGYWSSTPHTPTMYALYDQEHFLRWRSLLRDLGYDIREFVLQELEKGLLASQGWSEAALMFIFQTNIPSDPHTGPSAIGFPNCERCGEYGTKASARPMVDLKWRRQLRSIRKAPPQMEKNSLADSCSLDITISTVPSKDSCNWLGTILTETFEPNRQLPYRMVCCDPCRDGVSVAWLYENDSDNEPDLPSFPHKPVENDIEIESTIEDKDPTLNMPGSFI